MNPLYQIDIPMLVRLAIFSPVLFYLIYDHYKWVHERNDIMRAKRRDQ